MFTNNISITYRDNLIKITMTNRVSLVPKTNRFFLIAPQAKSYQTLLQIGVSVYLEALILPRSSTRAATKLYIGLSGRNL